MAMDAKDLRAEPALAGRSSDGGAKYAHTAALHDRTKTTQQVGSTSCKGDGQGARPCAVIGPDRVAPPARDAFPKKPPADPWLGQEPYRRPPDYPHKVAGYQDPTRNISPRQTFQENMQRIIMPPGYNAVKLNEDSAYASKNNKLNVPAETKYYDVPYNVNPLSSDQKNLRNADHNVSNMNPLLMKSVPHGWPPGSVNVRPLRQYGAPEVYQYPDLASCTGPRPPLTRHHSGHEEPSQLYADPYYHDSNIRFKPYPNIKERYPQTRYEYLGNFPNPYHPSHPFATHRSMPPHPYPGYPQVPLKYTDRVPESVMDGYQRSFSQQGNYGVPIRNPVIHPSFRPGPGNTLQSKLHQYPSEGTNKAITSNKLPYDPNNKLHVDYETSRSKAYPVSDNYYLNEMSRPYFPKSQIILPNYPPGSIHGVNAHPHPYYTKENIQMMNYDYAHFKNLDPSLMNNSLTKMPLQFSPSTLAISPADSNGSNETGQTHVTSQDDCGYFSQSSVTSVRSIDSLNRIPMDPYGRHDYRYGPMVRSSPQSKPDPNCNQVSKSKKDIRQFISSWSEGDDENIENSSNKDSVKNIPADTYSLAKQYDAAKNQEQLYVLGLVNVPSEELSKYEHIQKVSTLPKNIKGYNSLELLNQFEEAIESSKMNNIETSMKREGQIQFKNVSHRQDTLPRAVSPLDVEAKISQSVIHKDVGCNFEIKPCSPKMLNVEVAAPVQTILNERVIEKVANPISIKSPLVLQSVEENMDSILHTKTLKCPLVNTSSSCKMINNQLLSEASAIDNLKTNYSLQDLESNSGVCLASLPRLDNDIELSFPEVNQQFINANKTESIVNTSAAYSKDLPALDTERSENIALKNNVGNPEYDMNYQFSPKNKMETEKDSSRLSKYRKLKRNIPDDNDTTQARAQATRVDSVIIKNPENGRIIEDSSDSSYSRGYLRREAQEFAINLASQAKNSEAMRQGDSVKKDMISNKYEKTEMTTNNIIIPSKPDNLLNRTLNVEANYNNELAVQTEDLSMPYRELSNRHLENAALDTPINLSPQAKYSTIGVEEETRSNNICDNKHSDTKIDSKNNMISSCDGNQTQKELKDRSASTKMKTYEIFKDAQQENQKLLPLFDTQPADTRPISKVEQDVAISGNYLNFSKDCHAVPVHNLYDTEKRVLDLPSSDMTNDGGNDSKLDKNQMETSDISKTKKDQSFGLSSKIKPVNSSLKDDRKKIEEKIYSNVSGLKNNDCRIMESLQGENNNGFDMTRRKRSTENRSRSADRDIIKMNNKRPKLTLVSNDQTEHSIRKPILVSPQMSSPKDPIGENIQQETIPLNVLDEEKKKNATNSLNETNNTASDTDMHLCDKVEDQHINQCILNSDANGKSIISNVTKNNVSISEFCNNEQIEKTIEIENIVNVTEKEKNAPSKTAYEVPECVSDTDLNSDYSLTSKNNTTDDESILKPANESKKNDILKKYDGTSPLSNTNVTHGKLGHKNQEKFDLATFKTETRFSEPELIERDSTLDSSFNCNDAKGDNLSDSYEENNDGVRLILKGYIRKELFSSRFQNLLTYNDDVSTLLRCNNSNRNPILPAMQIENSKPLNNTPKLNDQDISIKTSTIITIDGKQNKSSVDVSSEECSSENPVFEVENKENNTNVKIEVNPKSVEKHLDDKPQVNASEYFEYDVEENVDIKKSDDQSKHIEQGNIDCKNVSHTSEEYTKQVNIENTVLISTTMLKEEEVLNELTNESYEKCTIEHPSNFKCSTLVSNKRINEDKIISVTQKEDDCESKIEFPIINHEYIEEKNNTSSYSFCEKPRFCLKRSLSDSALDAYEGEADGSTLKRCFMLPKKRNRCYISSNIDESHLLNIIQNSRRNSISTICNENNISFCILIDDNCIIAEENYEQDENNLPQVQDCSLNSNDGNYTSEEEKCASPTNSELGSDEINSDTCVTVNDLDKSWVDNVGYEAVIETEDIAENIVIGEPTTPKDTDSSDYESDDGDMGILNSAALDHTNKVKHIYGNNMCTNDAQLVDALYLTPQMDVNKKLMDRESQKTEKSSKCYDSDSLEMLLAEPINNYQRVASESELEFKCVSSERPYENLPDNKENDVRCIDDSTHPISDFNLLTDVTASNKENTGSDRTSPYPNPNEKENDNTIHSFESSLDNVFNYDQKEDISYTSSSPEVSSTTSEEKSSCILLKISNYKGTKISEVKDLSLDKLKDNSCKFTEKEYLNPNYSNSLPSHRPLITKAAQKYIPPIKESIPDLRVQLTLPQQSLIKLQKNKVSKEEPKLSTRNVYCYNNNVHPKKEIPKKVKPKFEDVLKNIDEVQFQKQKEKNKKTRKCVPKVVIKKNENGSHYASTSATSSFNPDLTGRKWQPWVFIEKNQFIDKMALRNKTMAVFSHRKKSFVLAENFCKYKAISSAKFTISQPKLNDFSKGNLKYTIKLKHSY